MRLESRHSSLTTASLISSALFFSTAFRHISSPTNSQMHAEAKLSKIILQNNAALEGAPREKVCQTDKCSAHNDNTDCYGPTVMKTVSPKPTSSIFISIEWRQISNLLPAVISSSRSLYADGCFTRSMHMFHDFYKWKHTLCLCLALSPIYLYETIRQSRNKTVLERDNSYL